MDKIRNELERAYELATNAGNYEGAFAICNRIVDENPNIPDGLRKRAAIYAAKCDFIRAVADITQAIEIESEVPEYYFFRGWWHLELGNFEQAYEDQSAAINLGNTHDFHYHDESAFFFRATALLHLRRFEEALADCKRVRDDFLIYLRRFGKLDKAEVVRNAMARRAS
jgi:tetratricopeptide (TPR) repeat protein